MDKSNDKLEIIIGHTHIWPMFFEYIYAYAFHRVRVDLRFVKSE